MALIENRIYYTYNDVTIMPSVVSDIEHRSECITWDAHGMLPLFTAPMDTVVSEKNFDLFQQNHINAILPRTAPLETRVFYSTNKKWAAYSLSEFEEVFCNEEDKLETPHIIKVLIDVANGHMKKIAKLVLESRLIYGDNIKIMVGNIANPQTYETYARIGVDYIRCGIGSGCGCLSTSNTGIHMPMATLISDIAKLKEEIKDDYRHLPYIVADGGIRNYSDAIKALALGADYVMVGSLFAQMLESAAPKSCMSFPLPEVKNIHLEDGLWHGDYKKDTNVYLGTIYATFYGMASKDGQIALSGSKTKTSEGIKKQLLVNYTMEGWTKNFIDYLRSAMSYVGADTLPAFRSLATVIVNSPNAVNAVNK